MQAFSSGARTFCLRKRHVETRKKVENGASQKEPGRGLGTSTYNLRQNKWKTLTSPQIKDGKMARFCPSRGWGFAVPFYFVQDCSTYPKGYYFYPFLIFLRHNIKDGGYNSKMSLTTFQNAPPPLTGSLQRSCILGGRKLLVYVRTQIFQNVLYVCRWHKQSSRVSSVSLLRSH